MSFSPSRIFVLCFSLLAAAFSLAPVAASAYVTTQQAQSAADRAVTWFAGEQAENGNIAGFGGDWTMIALSNAGVNAADLKAESLTPSLQDFYATSWIADGPGTASTDQARALLAGHGGGIRGAELASDQNLVAKQFSYFNGTQLGLASTVNDDMFGLLALRDNGISDLSPTLEAEVRRAQSGGGWNYSAKGGQPDVDMSGAGLGTLCAAGASVDDPAVVRALDYVKSMQDPATGGFISEYFGVNSDSTGWVVNGLRECGIDPQAPEWTTTSGKNPLDFLTEMQKDNGAFRWRPGDQGDNLYSTQDAVTALVGDGFGTDPAPREDPEAPLFRPAPEVDSGTTVPFGLLIDHGPAVPGAERACTVDAPVDGIIGEAIGNAETGLPEDCASDVKIEGDGTSSRLTSVNGVSEDATHVWKVSVNGGPESATLDAAIPLGATLRTTYVTRDGKPDPDPDDPILPPVEPPANPAPRRAKVVLPRSAKLKVRKDRVRVAVSCPRGNGRAGCLGILRVRFRHNGRGLVAGTAQYHVSSGRRKMVQVRLKPRFLKLANRSAGGKRRVILDAVTKDQPTGSATRTRAGAIIRR